MIGKSTRLAGLIGDPVDQSLSPRIQNHALSRAAIDAVYLAMRVRPQDLVAAVAGLRAIGAVGFNVTVPHKIAVIEHLDDLDPLAAKIGAVNTVVLGGGGAVGYNTDAPGFLLALDRECRFEVTGSRVLVVGTGGAARAVSAALAGAGAAEVMVTGRSASRVGRFCGSLEKARPLLELAGSSFDLVVNATSVGMPGGPAPDDLPLDLTLLRDVGMVYDLVYRLSGTTPLLAACNEMGIRAYDGRSMLAAQAKIAFSLLFGADMDLEIFSGALL